MCGKNPMFLRMMEEPLRKSPNPTRHGASVSVRFTVTTYLQNKISSHIDWGFEARLL